MSQVTITAPNGRRLKVRVQKHEDHSRVIPEVRNAAGELVAPGKTETFKSWSDTKIEHFGSEARDYEIVDGQERIVVEDAGEQPAAEQRYESIEAPKVVAPE